METPVDTEILVDQWCVNFPVRIEGRDMPGNLYFLDMHYFFLCHFRDGLGLVEQERKKPHRLFLCYGLLDCYERTSGLIYYLLFLTLLSSGWDLRTVVNLLAAEF